MKISRARDEFNKGITISEITLDSAFYQQVRSILNSARNNLYQSANSAIPNEIFSNKKDDHDRLADGILDIFDRYNFTMSEDEPMEREVAIDPEMLGKVFENLLDVTDRKSKGAFYTPREIVHYMCQESLINYLAGVLKVNEASVRDLFFMAILSRTKTAAS